MATTSISTETDEHLALIPGYDPVATAAEGMRFDPGSAQRVIDFFRTHVRHVQGHMAGKPYMLEPWEAAVLANTFGWLREDGTRRYREVFYYVPRKNSKSTLGAGLILYMLLVDPERNAQVVGAAADRAQASLIYDIAKLMVLTDVLPSGRPGPLARRCTVTKSQKTISLADGSFYRAISADAETKHGLNLHCVVIDELHAQPNRELVDVLMTSTAARKQPLVVHFTTADYDRPSICNEKLSYARKVRDGVIQDPAFLPVIYEALASDDWKDRAVWHRVNPNLGKSKSLEYMEREFQRAQDQPTYVNTFKRLELNQQTPTDVRWLDMSRWDACPGAIDLEALAGRRCWGGLDLGQTDDLTAFVLAFEGDEEGTVIFHATFWCPQEIAEKRDRVDRVPYLTWIREGWIKTTPGDWTDYRFVERDILAMIERYELVDIAVDPYNAAQTIRALEDAGHQTVIFRQGFQNFAAPTKDFDRRVRAGMVNHGGNPVLRWNASNACAKENEHGDIMLVKGRSADKIDGIVACLMALARLNAQEELFKSIYESGESLFL